MPAVASRARRVAALVALMAIGISLLSASPAHAGSSTLLITEVDYDQPSDDTGEFIEIYNVGRSPASLNNVAILLFNGSQSPATEYGRITLGGKLGPRSILTIASDTIPFLLPGGGAVVSLPGTSDQIQNGAPDGLALVNLSTFAVIDAIAYEGAIPAAQIVGGPVVDLGPSVGTDTGTLADTSLSRKAMDLDNNASTDWRMVDSTPSDHNCVLVGTSGNDQIVDASKNGSVLCGGPGNDTLTGLDGGDLLIGGPGNDGHLGGRGDDVIDGRSGMDMVGFYDSGVASGVTANLAEGWSDNAQLGSDWIVFAGPEGAEASTIEHLKGSPYADLLIGDSGPNSIEAREGDDVVHGGAGNDVLRGNAGGDSLYGEDGDDTIQPGAGNDPVVDGGSGINLLDYTDIRGPGEGQVVDFAAGMATGGAGTDGLIGFTHVNGTARNDHLTVAIDGVQSFVSGAGGDDVVSTLDADALDWNVGADGFDTCYADATETVMLCEA
jgi:hemolysin type calcium-binding protein